MQSKRPIRRALVSVSDKTGVVEFCRQLAAHDIEILSTGGTAKLLREQQIPVTDVADYTGFPEIMGGRVKTLHPKVHGGILGRRDIDAEVATEHGIEFIDLLVVNLYPFQQTVAKPGCTYGEAIENIDIGGPTMLRAAAKNHEFVSVVVDAKDYDTVLEEISQNKELDFETRKRLALKAFSHTANYDAAIVAYLSETLETATTSEENTHADNLALTFTKVQELRYGENPHQKASFYREANPYPGSIAAAKLLQGKTLSFNNIVDADAALDCIKEFATYDDAACVIVKHANPCGVALAPNLSSAYQRAYLCDPTSAFGGIIAFNQVLDEETAQNIINQQFVEVVIAPSITESAQAVFANKPNVRVLACGALDTTPSNYDEYKRVSGGILRQDKDTHRISTKDLKVVTKRQPSAEEIADLLFCWQVTKHVKSNAIVYAKNQQTVGIGAGQMSRVYSAKIAGIKAKDENLEVVGSVMASDAFFPFRDGIDMAAESGIRAIIQPGGSMRDEEVIQAADEHDIAMVFTGIRHFKH